MDVVSAKMDIEQAQRLQRINHELGIDDNFFKKSVAERSEKLAELYENIVSTVDVKRIDEISIEQINFLEGMVIQMFLSEAQAGDLRQLSSILERFLDAETVQHLEFNRSYLDGMKQNVELVRNNIDVCHWMCNQLDDEKQVFLEKTEGICETIRIGISSLAVSIKVLQPYPHQSSNADRVRTEITRASIERCQNMYDSAMEYLCIIKLKIGSPTVQNETDMNLKMRCSQTDLAKALYYGGYLERFSATPLANWCLKYLDVRKQKGEVSSVRDLAGIIRNVKSNKNRRGLRHTAQKLVNRLRTLPPID